MAFDPSLTPLRTTTNGAVFNQQPHHLVIQSNVLLRRASATTLFPNNFSPIACRSQCVSKTRLYKKWGPRWNPPPDSDYYKRGGDDDLDGYNRIHFSGRNRKSKFVATFGKTRIFSLQRFLVFINIAFFLKQIQSSINYLPAFNKVLENSGYPYELYTKLDIILEEYLLGSSPTIVEGKAFPTLGSRGRAYGRSLIVASSLGPFTMDFVNQRLLTRIQSHRYLTSGFLHGSLIHLLFNMNYLWRFPRWIENNGGSGNGQSGWCLYLTTYVLSIIAGNLFRDYFSTSGVGMTTLCLGASGGICGINGLMFAMLQKMGNSQGSMAVLKNVAFLILFGSMANNVSNASHIGGFLCGGMLGWFFGPNYRKGYSSSKWNYDGNETPSDYKLAMGAGVEPDQPFFPLKYIYGALCLSCLFNPKLRVIPEYILKGFTSPGSLSGMYV